ncbi:MAG TPA: flagellar biosynthetic protein FliQ [Rhodospirillaceae bacterium]|jgi:flagellar biosynthetic protein FliQ|nr:flagellar biosynthesis protein FliQ [Alphaproteobacteria bacterium]HBH26687.1 flagellar biosynthetic protein FliQ [Rhodospirillaceae bacterium]
MTEQGLIELGQEAIWLVVTVSLPVLLVGLAVGVTIALLQALTQIQEITLVFVPKIIAMFLALFLFLPAMMGSLVLFTREMLGRMVAGG